METWSLNKSKQKHFSFRSFQRFSSRNHLADKCPQKGILESLERERTTGEGGGGGGGKNGGSLAAHPPEAEARFRSCSFGPARSTPQWPTHLVPPFITRVCVRARARVASGHLGQTGSSNVRLFPRLPASRDSKKCRGGSRGGRGNAAATPRLEKVVRFPGSGMDSGSKCGRILFDREWGDNGSFGPPCSFRVLEINEHVQRKLGQVEIRRN